MRYSASDKHEIIQLSRQGQVLPFALQITRLILEYRSGAETGGRQSMGYWCADARGFLIRRCVTVEEVVRTIISYH